MSKATVVFSDNAEELGKIDIKVQFDPPVDKGDPDALTPAQSLVLNLLDGLIKVSDEGTEVEVKP